MCKSKNVVALGIDGSEIIRELGFRYSWDAVCVCFELDG